MGRITLPGLPVPVGEAAINPGPRAQIALAVDAVCAPHALRGELPLLSAYRKANAWPGIHSMPGLGIVGGISILGIARHDPAFQPPRLAKDH